MGGARLAALWLALWLGSLALPVAIMGRHIDDIYRGWSILMIGWMGAFVLQFGWFANLAFLLAVGMLAFSRKRTLWASVLTFPLVAATVDALFWHEIDGDNGPAQIQSFGVGYYLWFAAMIGAAASLAWCSSRWRTDRPV